jgi:hypothetical protein
VAQAASDATAGTSATAQNSRSVCAGRRSVCAPAASSAARAALCGETRLRPAVTTPKHAGLRADDAVAAHRAAGGAGRSIKRARTCAHGTSRGAVARSLYPSRRPQKPLKKKRRRSAVMTLSRAGLRADDAVASHRAVGGAGRSIKRAPTCAHNTSRGAVAVGLHFGTHPVARLTF